MTMDAIPLVLSSAKIKTERENMSARRRHVMAEKIGIDGAIDKHLGLLKRGPEPKSGSELENLGPRL
jgi:hypothetical protein